MTLTSLSANADFSGYWIGWDFEGRKGKERARFRQSSLAESDAADPSEGATRWVAPSVPEKPRQDSRR